jgi:hypothetical protein
MSQKSLMLKLARTMEESLLPGRQGASNPDQRAPERPNRQCAVSRDERIPVVADSPTIATIVIHGYLP